MDPGLFQLVLSESYYLHLSLGGMECSFKKETLFQCTAFSSIIFISPLNFGGKDKDIALFNPVRNNFDFVFFIMFRKSRKWSEMKSQKRNLSNPDAA